MICENITIQVAQSELAGRLTLYLHERSPELLQRKRPIVVICPGGAYCSTSDRESEPVALKYLSMGYHAAVLRYSVAPARYPEALLQLASSVAILRKKAELWDIDPEKIIIQGFSAGGHLAASLGVFWNKPFVSQCLGVDASSVRPNGLILSYPVITSGKFTHQESMRNLLGEGNEDQRLEQSLEMQVSKDTPPTFLWHTLTDAAVPVENSLLFFKALKDNGVPVELHIFPNGPHGLSLATIESADYAGEFVNESCASWINLANQWIKSTFSL